MRALAVALLLGVSLGAPVAAQAVTDPAPAGGPIDPALIEGDEALPEGAVIAPVPEVAAPPLDDTAPDAMPEIDAMPDDAVQDIQTGEVAAGDPVAADPSTPALDARSLADMRADLASLGRALQSLRAELVASGPSGFTAAGGTAAIDRMDRMEAEIARLTGEVETLRNRVEASVAEAANRAGDIEFRLCESDPTCDLGALTTAQLDSGTVQGGTVQGGMGSPVDAGAVQPATPAGSPEENAAFDRASAALAAGDAAGAAAQFSAFATAHADSPLAPEAMFLRGEALSAAGDRKAAAAAWLEAFTAAPQGPRAPQALLAFAGALAQDGRTEEACRFYADLAARFPAAPATTDGLARAQALHCADATPPEAAPGTDDG